MRTIRDAGPGDYTWVISPRDSIGVVATGKTANIAMLKRTLAMQFSSGLRAHGDSIDVDKGAATDGQRNAGNEIRFVALYSDRCYLLDGSGVRAENPGAQTDKRLIKQTQRCF